jgi:hypothetical protein
MKISIVLTALLALGLGLAARGQESYQAAMYPSSKYRVTKKDFPLAQLTVTVIALIPKDQSEEGKVWVEQRKAEKLLSSRKVGAIASEYGVYIPHPQPLRQYFVLVQCGEYEGMVHVADSTGKWTRFPGYYFAVHESKRSIIAKQANEEGNFVRLFSFLYDQVYDKRLTDNELKNYRFYEVKETDWIR